MVSEDKQAIWPEHTVALPPDGTQAFCKDTEVRLLHLIGRASSTRISDNRRIKQVTLPDIEEVGQL